MSVHSLDFRQDKQLWYVELPSGCVIARTDKAVKAMLVLAFISKNTQVSQDGKRWEPLHQVPQLVPECMVEDITIKFTAGQE